MNWKTKVMTAALMSLAACGVSSTTGPTRSYTPVSQGSGTLPNGFTPRYNAATDTITVALGGEYIDFTANPVTDDVRGFRFYQTDEPGSAAFRAETASGRGVATGLLSRTSHYDASGVQVARIGMTTVPVTGSAVYRGDYVAILNERDIGFAVPIEGDVEIAADFANAELNGRVYNRTPIHENAGISNIINDLEFDSYAFGPSGQFNGNATGGQIVGDTFTPGSSTTFGDMRAIYVGAEGAELIGGIDIEHTYEGLTLVESGAFITSR